MIGANKEQIEQWCKERGSKRMKKRKNARLTFHTSYNIVKNKEKY